MGREDAIEGADHAWKEPGPGCHVGSVCVCECVAGNDLSHCLNYLPGLDDLADEDCIPASVDLFSGCRQLQGGREMVEVLSRVDLSTLVPFILKIVLERLAQLR